MMIHLTHIDPTKNMARWYIVGVQPTLLDDCAVICGWGRIGTAYERWRILPAKSKQQAHNVADNIVKKKVGRGYVRVNEYSKR